MNAPVTTVATQIAQSAIPTISSTAVGNATTSTVASTVVKSVATTTTTTTPAAPLKNPDDVKSPPPLIAAIAPGDAAVTVGDEIAPATVERVDNQLTVTSGDLSATVGGIAPDGGNTSLDADGNVRLQPGDTVRIKMAGFDPGSTVEAWLFSTPQLMGTAKVGADGMVVGTFTIPQDISLGSHRIAIVAQTVDGKSATLAVGIKVGDWKKGRSITVWLIVLPIVLAMGGALLLPAVIRRRRHEG